MSREINDKIPFKEGNVSYHSLAVEGVSLDDYPDFCDCWIGYGEWEDGTELSESELEDLQTTYTGLAYELAIDFIY